MQPLDIAQDYLKPKRRAVTAASGYIRIQNLLSCNIASVWRHRTGIEKYYIESCRNVNFNQKNIYIGNHVI